MDEVKEAKIQFEIAENHFNWAEPEYIDKAIEEYNQALENLNNAYKNAKTEKQIVIE